MKIFRPKPKTHWTSPWSYHHTPPLEECGLWWRFWLSEEMKSFGSLLLAIGVVSAAILFALLSES